MDRQTDGQTDGQADGRTDGWTDGQTKPLIELRVRKSKGNVLAFVEAK